MDLYPILMDHNPVLTDFNLVSRDHNLVLTDPNPALMNLIPVLRDYNPVLTDLNLKDHNPISKDQNLISKDHNPISKDHNPISTALNPISNDGMVKKTGPLSFLAIILIVSQLSLIFLISEDNKDKFYYMTKVKLITISLLRLHHEHKKIEVKIFKLFLLSQNNFYL